MPDETEVPSWVNQGRRQPRRPTSRPASLRAYDKFVVDEMAKVSGMKQRQELNMVIVALAVIVAVVWGIVVGTLIGIQL